MDVSRIAVRAALDKLSALRDCRKTTWGRDVSLGDRYKQWCEKYCSAYGTKGDGARRCAAFRLYFEPGNVVEFMRNYDPEIVAELSETYELMKQHVYDEEQFYLADLKSHTIIARGTKNPIVNSIDELLMGMLAASMDLIYSKMGPEFGLKYRGAILDAIVNQDTEMATLLMIRHIEENIMTIQKNCIEKQ